MDRSSYHSILIAKTYDYALIDRFLGSAGFIGSAASFAILTVCLYETA